MTPTSPAALSISIDHARLARAVTLRAIKQEPGIYIVEGGSRPHRVDVRDHTAPVCRCEDRIKAPCSHILAALICEGEPVVVAAAQVLMLTTSAGSAA